jgi:acyl-CoA thioester hydrolase
MIEWSKSIEVRWADVDANQHVRHSAYADYATHVRVEWMLHSGFGPSRLAELKIGPIIVEERTQYFKELRMSERIRVDLALAGLSADGQRYRFRQHFYREDGRLAARYELTGLWLDLSTRRRAPPPPGVNELIRQLVRTDDFVTLDVDEPKAPAP